MGKFEKLAGVLALTGALAAPVEAQENQQPMVLAAMNNTSGQVTDCVGFVRGQIALAQDNGAPMSRDEIVSLAADCRGGQLQDRIAEQQRIIASLNEQIAHLQIRVDEQGRLLDANNQEIARILSINGQLIIRRQEVQTDTAALNAEATASRARQEEMLRQAEEILQSLATS